MAFDGQYALSVAAALAPTVGFSAMAVRAHRARLGARASVSENVFVILAECAASVLVTVLLWPLR